jgi:outer membrane autotransporter protein
VKHGPFIGAEYQNLDVDRFSSRGGPLVVGVDDYGIDSLRGLIGYRINGEMGGFRPYISAAYAHEFKDDFNDTTGTIGGVDFDIQGPRLRSAFIVTAGSGFALSQNLMLDIGYRGEIRYEGTGISSHGGTVGLSYSF